MLRKYLIITLATTWAWSVPGAALAQLIVSDGFAYAPGTITGDNGGTGWANAWTSSDANNPNQVTGGGLTFGQNGAALAVSGNKLTAVGSNVGAYRRPPTAFGLYGGNHNQDVWVGFLAQNTGSANGYGGLSFFNSTEQFFVGKLSDAGVYGFQNTSVSAVQDSEDGPQTTTVGADGTTHFLVTQFSFTDSGTTYVTLYVDATPGVAGADGLPTQQSSASATYSDSFQFGELRFQSGPDSSATINFDELRMGSSYLDVAPQAVAPVPEPSAGMAWLIGVGLLAVVAARRRRVAA